MTKIPDILCMCCFQNNTKNLKKKIILNNPYIYYAYVCYLWSLLEYVCLVWSTQVNKAECPSCENETMQKPDAEITIGVN